LDIEGVGLVRGDIELHIKKAYWHAHGHGGDPNYNGVVVHGALEVTSPETLLQSGSLAPVMDLSALLTEASEKGPALDLWQVLAGKGFPRPCSLEDVAKTLDRAGDDRFQSKADWLWRCIQADGPDQAIYQDLMEGLGYRSNRSPFIRLAAAAPYRAVSQAALSLPASLRVAAIGGWLIDLSGLDGAALRPSRSSRRRSNGMGPVMDGQEWHLFRVRPANHPRRGVLGAAMLLNRFLEPGLAAGLRDEVRKLSPASLCGAGEG